MAEATSGAADGVPPLVAAATDTAAGTVGGGSASLPVAPTAVPTGGGGAAGVVPGVGGLPVEGGVDICKIDGLPEIGVEARIAPSLASLTANKPMSVSTVAILDSTVMSKGCASADAMAVRSTACNSSLSPVRPARWCLASSRVSSGSAAASTADWAAASTLSVTSIMC